MSLRALLGLRGRPERTAIERVKALARAALGEAPEVSLAVNEIACDDPACPGVETVILVMEPGRRTRAAKVQKALEDVTAEDVAAALAGPPLAS